MAKLDLRKPVMPAVILTVVVLALNWIFNTLGYVVQPLFASISPVSPVTGTVGQQFLGWLGGIIPIDQFLTMGLFVTFISAYLILLVGRFVIDTLKLPTAKGRVGELSSRILWGTAVFYLLIVGPVMKAWGVLVGLLFYTVIAAYVTGIVADKLKVSM